MRLTLIKYTKLFVGTIKFQRWIITDEGILEIKAFLFSERNIDLSIWKSPTQDLQDVDVPVDQLIQSDELGRRWLPYSLPDLLGWQPLYPDDQGEVWWVCHLMNFSHILDVVPNHLVSRKRMQDLHAALHYLQMVSGGEDEVQEDWGSPKNIISFRFIFYLFVTEVHPTT